ncbi:MAG TPA: TOMM precursor leader peptide-binding protein [Polyangia bacterium]
MLLLSEGRRPVLKTHLRIEDAGETGLFLCGEGTLVHLEGALFSQLLPLLDGRRTTQEIVRALGAELDAASAYYALHQLEERGCLADAETLGDRERAEVAYWHAVGQDPAAVAASLADRPIELVTVGEAAVGDATANDLRELLAMEGVRVTGDVWPKVVLVDDYLHDGLAAIDAAARREGGEWLLARPAGRVLWVGPWFGGRGAACWHCLADRLRGRRAIERLAASEPGASLHRPVRGSTPATRVAATGLLAATVVRMLAAADGDRTKLVVIDPALLRLEEHRVVRRPQCAACGQPSLLAHEQARPLHLQSRPKTFTADGGHRTTAPEQTLRNYQHHVSAITGVVHTLEQIHVTPDEIAPIFDAGYNLARQGESLPDVRQIFRARSGGKGATPAQARASGLGAALERYRAAFQGDEARRYATRREIGEAAVDPTTHLLFSERQYRMRAALNAGQRKRSFLVPEPFDDSRPTDWSPAWSLTRGEMRQVATAACYYGYQHRLPPAFCWADSNGCASGNVIEEAVLQGFFEVAERDAVAIWWYNRVPRPAVDLTSFDEPYFARLGGHYARLGRELWVLDVSADLGVPVFAAISRRVARGDDDDGAEQITIGFGAHSDARLGILRALTEMNQFLPVLSDDGAVTVSDQDVLAWLSSARLAEHAHLAPAAAPPRRAGDYRQPVRADLRDDVMACVDLARRQELEVLVHLQTRPDVGLPVVKVIVPGLRHFWPRFAPGRLYDVPVRLRWRTAPTPEEALNPIPIFF